MKVILSRKGFDSSYGGCPSPILPDGTLLSLPIPEMKFTKDLNTKEDRAKWKTWENKQFQPLAYSNLSLPKSAVKHFEEMGSSNLTYRDVINELLPKGVLREGKKTYEKNLQWTCHLDPDLVSNVIVRPQEWRCLFGQGGAAETHLKNQNVGENDLFLFFGWFRKTVLQNGKLQFDSADKSGIHIIYGYLQVDYKISFFDNREKAKSWMSYHPHLRLNAWNNERNAVYVGRKTLSWDDKKPGATIFQYDPSLVLTDTTNNNPKKLRTYWRAELFPEDMDITYHSKNSLKKETDEKGNISKYFKSADRGQEFVISNPTLIMDWVKSLIR